MNSKNNHIDIFSPKVLYGRKNELKICSIIYKRILKGNKELLFVSGYSGIGKSALIHEAKKSIVKDKVYFISGKFDQFERNVPYKAIKQLYQDLIYQILSSGPVIINKFKNKILNALGANAQVIINVIPELELLIGKQPDIPELDIIENQNRFKIYFQKFTYLFATVNHPLIMFIDDLQWADLASLNLIKTMVLDNDIKYFLIIGAYRDNEINEVHPLRLILDDIKKAKVQINSILLDSLKKSDIFKLLIDSLNAGKNDLSELSEIIYKKTHGNPFFIYQFLNILYKEKILILDADKNENKWYWNIAEIYKEYVTDNVGDILSKKISILSKDDQQILAFCSCMGNRFELKNLAVAKNIKEIETIHLLSSIIKEDFIFFSEGFYYFVHDQVQEAAYSLLSDINKKKYHYQIGTSVLKKLNNDEYNKKIFFILDQLNSGIDIIENEEEINSIIDLNLKAGKKAKESTAYSIALKYFKKGIELLGDNSWDKKYNLTLKFYNETAETAFLNADFEYMNTIIELIIKNTKIFIDKVKAYEVKIHSLIAMSKIFKTVKTGHNVLKNLGISLKIKPTNIDVLLEFIKTNIALKGKSFDELKDMKKMSDQKMIEAINIMMTIGAVTYNAVPNLVTVMILKIIRLELKNGASPYSSYLYGSYGILLAGVLFKIDLAYKFGEFSLSLIKDKKLNKLHSKIHLIFNIFIKHWKYHLNTTFKPLIDNYQKALELGDFEYAGLSLLSYCTNLLFSGKNLSFLEIETKKYSIICKRLKQEFTLITIMICRQFIIKLIGKTVPDTSVTEELYDSYIDENVIYEKLIKEKNITDTSILFLFKSMFNYLLYNYKEALSNIKITGKYSTALIGLIFYPIYIFYFSLIICANYKTFSIIDKMRYSFILLKNQRMMKKWAKYCPENFLNKYYLIEAEIKNIKKQKNEVLDLFNNSIFYSKKNEYLNEEAVANELAAKFCFINNLENKGKNYINEAYRCYMRWGAVVKVKHLEEKYSDYIKKTYQY